MRCSWVNFRFWILDFGLAPDGRKCLLAPDRQGGTHFRARKVLIEATVRQSCDQCDDSEPDLFRSRLELFFGHGDGWDSDW
jgi:hypothetical protein